MDLPSVDRRIIFLVMRLKSHEVGIFFGLRHPFSAGTSNPFSIYPATVRIKRCAGLWNMTGIYDGNNHESKYYLSFVFRDYPYDCLEDPEGVRRRSR